MSRGAQYQTRLKRWGFTKYVKAQPEDVRIAAYKVEKAKKRGKTAQVYFRGQPMSEKMLGRQGFATFAQREALERGELPFDFHRPDWD